MARYFVTIVGSVLIPVEAESEEQARDIVEDFMDFENEDFMETISTMDYEIGDCEEVEPDMCGTTMGLSAKEPRCLHDIEED